ncbi:MAG TPA: hypothetical protein VEU08_14260 [Vicinamibacterales bacterium]|nr:hypothetical protein [Vicinamibacterales bacterium]
MSQDRQQRGPDRRRHPRGGRRGEDKPGFTPLVMVIDPDPNRRDISEAILAKLRFAVAPVESVEKGVSVIRALAPAAIVGHAEDLERLRAALPLESIPLVAVTDAMARTDQLAQVVRAALRLSQTLS